MNIKALIERPFPLIVEVAAGRHKMKDFTVKAKVGTAVTSFILEIGNAKYRFYNLYDAIRYLDKD